MAELWELVDINKRKTGRVIERGSNVLIPEGMYHMVVEIWTKDSKGKILLTQRHPNKHFGLLWEASGGAIIAGEESRDAAQRELKEETGIDVEKEQLQYLGCSIGSNCMMESYLCVLDEAEPKLQLQAEEVVDYQFVTAEELVAWKIHMVEGAWKRFCRYIEQIMKA